MCVFAAHAGSAVVLGPGLTEATVSVEAFFTIASVDAYGNRYSDGPDGPSGPLSWYSNAHGPDRYQVLLQSPSAGSGSLSGHVANNRDGTYAVTYTPTKSDPVLASALTVRSPTSPGVRAGAHLKRYHLHPPRLWSRGPRPSTTHGRQSACGHRRSTAVMNSCSRNPLIDSVR